MPLPKDMQPITTTDGTVSVWQVALTQSAVVVTYAASLLAADEQARAARFHFDRDRDRYVVARGALRLILAHCLGGDAAALRFDYSEAGKPGLAPGVQAAGETPLHFNLSHSHEQALVAVARGAAVGVDVEYQREMQAGDMADIARRFFSARESARLLALPAAAQPAAFFRCWTRKEAYLKARGEGIFGGLDRFDVSFADGEAPALLSHADDPAEVGRWSLLDLVPADGYAAAVAIAAPTPQLVLKPWRFADEGSR